MKIRLAGYIYIICIFILLVFQALWIFYTYSLEKEKIYTTINTSFQESVQEELILRMHEVYTNMDSIMYNTDKSVTKIEDIIGPNEQFVEIDPTEGLNNGVLQQIMLIEGASVNLFNLDSLFRKKLENSGYSLDYLICYRDSTDQLIESIGMVRLEQDIKAFQSDSIPIVNKTYAHLISHISLPVVFKQMIGLTIASFFMLLLLLLALTYQIRFIYNQYRLSKLREDFSHALIHDLKSPLNTIHIVLSNYKNGLFEKNPEFGVKSNAIAIEQVLNIQVLVDKILTIAQSEENKLHLSRTEINLPTLIHRLIEKYTFAGSKQITFETHYVLNNALIYVDEALIDNAISNLIDNAIKYSKETVHIRISGEIKEDKLYIRIEDNGFGISQEEQLKIFNKFERGSAIYRKGAKGFGLGLSYVRQVAVAHQGTVALSSIKGIGSEFVIVIPLLLTPFEGYVENKNETK